MYVCRCLPKAAAAGAINRSVRNRKSTARATRSRRSSRPPPGGLTRRRREKVFVGVVLGIESRVDVEPGAHAPMVDARRRAVGRHGAGVADTIFVGMRRDPRHLLSLARGQRKCDLRPPGLHRELAYMP